MTLALKKAELLGDRDRRLIFIRELAGNLFMDKGSPSVSIVTLLELYQYLFFDDVYGTSIENLRDALEAELSTSTFLVKDHSIEGYRFTHKPFYEFFVADWILDVLLDKSRIDLGKAVLAEEWPSEIARYVVDLYTSELLVDTLTNQGLAF